jgi:hypothetical protein
MTEPTVTGPIVFDTFRKLAHHLDRAEVWQARVEAYERAAERQVVGSQDGKMARKDKSVLPVTVMIKNILSQNHEYINAVSNRNGHQAQVMMYAAARTAGIGTTANGLVKGQMTTPIQ